MQSIPVRVRSPLRYAYISILLYNMFQVNISYIQQEIINLFLAVSMQAAMDASAFWTLILLLN